MARGLRAFHPLGALDRPEHRPYRLAFPNLQSTALEGNTKPTAAAPRKITLREFISRHDDVVERIRATNQNSPSAQEAPNSLAPPIAPPVQPQEEVEEAYRPRVDVRALCELMVSELSQLREEAEAIKFGEACGVATPREPETSATSSARRFGLFIGPDEAEISRWNVCWDGSTHGGVPNLHLVNNVSGEQHWVQNTELGIRQPKSVEEAAILIGMEIMGNPLADRESAVATSPKNRPKTHSGSFSEAETSLSTVGANTVGASTVGASPPPVAARKAAPRKRDSVERRRLRERYRQRSMSSISHASLGSTTTLSKITETKATETAGGAQGID
mmetsp:Transcript_31021/g.98511  ORF Transcript_31021/g.98511 Transcript_31021/m.98511 type:complete len:332 (-) Transcript_31021:1880-2875(-)